MKKSTKVAILLIAVLVVVLAAAHLMSRPADVSGTILINGERVSISSFESQSVTGTTVNGKGETREINAIGIPLTAISEDKNVRITSADEYHAEVTADELSKAWLLLEDDGSLRLIVFGDENAKRNVKNVSRIEY